MDRTETSSAAGLLRRAGPYWRIAVVLTCVANLGAIIIQAGSSSWSGIIHVVFVVVAFLFSSYVYFSNESPKLTRSILLLVSIPLVAALFIAPHDSHDLYSYGFYGWVVDHFRANPYVVAPVRFNGDAVAGLTTWRYAPSVYGPIFTLLSAGVMLISHRPFYIHFIFQLLSLSGLVGIAALINWRFHSPRATILCLSSPLCVVSAVNGGHNDTLVVFAVLGFLLFVERKQFVWAGLAMTFAAGIKVTALVAVFAVLLWMFSHKQRSAIWRLLGFSVVPTLAIYAFTYAGVLKSLNSATTHLSMSSIWRYPSMGVLHITNTSTTSSFSIPPIWATALFSVAAFVLWRRRSFPELSTLCCVMMLLYVVTSRYVLPWYMLWFMPLAWALLPRKLGLLVNAYVGVVLIGYLGHTGFQPVFLKIILRYVVELGAPILALSIVYALFKEKQSLDQTEYVSIGSGGVSFSNYAAIARRQPT